MSNLRGWGAKEVGAAIEGSVKPVADRVSAAVDKGVASVGRALEDPTAAMNAELLKQSDLPELAEAAPLNSLALRLDREADLWRGAALRQQSRAAWMDRLAMASAVTAFIALLILAAIAAVRAVFASGGAMRVSMLLGSGALLVMMGALLLGRFAARIRQAQIESAREALSRADLAEVRLHRVAVLLELRTVDSEAYRTALRGLEGEVRAN